MVNKFQYANFSPLKVRLLSQKFSKVTCFYSYVFNKRACTFILFWEPYVTLHSLILACTFINLKETIVPARLLKPAPFWIFLLVVSKKKVKSAGSK